MAEFVPCPTCDRPINGALPSCPYCAGDAADEVPDGTADTPSPVRSGDSPRTVSARSQPRPPVRSEERSGGEIETTPVFRRLDGPSMFLFLGLGLSLLAAAYALYADIRFLDLVIALRDDTFAGTFRDARDIGSAVDAAALAGLQVYIVVGIVWIVWMYRMYRNVEAAFGRARRFRAGWAIGGWFVPFLNFVRPRQVMGDIWAQSGEERQAPVPWFFNVWWATFLVAGVLGRLSRLDGTESLEETVFSAGVWIATDLVQIVGAVFALIVVHRTTQRQNASARARSLI